MTLPKSYANLKSPISDRRSSNRSVRQSLAFFFEVEIAVHGNGQCLRNSIVFVLELIETCSFSYCTKKIVFVSASRRNHRRSLVYVRTYIEFIQVSTLRQAEKYECQ